MLAEYSGIPAQKLRTGGQNAEECRLEFTKMQVGKHRNEGWNKPEYGI